jgi:hypothetical protein
MNQNIDRLCGDSLFQLNLSIWLAQPKPKDFAIRPIFHEIGFSIYSIGLLIALPPDIRLIVDNSNFEYQDAARPDLILATADRKRLCFLECKRSSFGIASTATEQARTLILLTGPIVTEVMAIGRRGSAQGILAYLTRKDQMKDLERTLEAISGEMTERKLETGKHGCFGIGSNEKALLIEYSDEMKKIMNFGDNSPIEILSIDKDTDPRPLYFIPYDPSVFNEQSEEERKICRRILFERFLGQIVSKLGSSITPSDVVLTRIEILKSVTFDLYDVWDDNEAKKHIRSLLRDFMVSLMDDLDSDMKRLIEHDPQRGWVFKLDSPIRQEEMIKQICKFKPEGTDLSKDIPPELFD